MSLFFFKELTVSWRLLSFILEYSYFWKLAKAEGSEQIIEFFI